MARSKPTTTVVADVKQAEAAMLELAQIGRDYERVRLNAEEEIAQVKENTRNEMGPLLDRRKKLEDAICTFATLNKVELFSKRKSLDTPYGLYGFRKSTKLQTLPKIKLSDVLERLRELSITEAIKVKSSVDKEAMRDWPDSRLETVGMRRISNDEFFLEVSRDALGDEA
ncbi:MAG: host-nuclease inhibitor Gam family protein [Pseudodesulfovibrio sp.]|nr:host-nuclease inhibitor Gam family protein [Pseudodesulfovibrio sp.]